MTPQNVIKKFISKIASHGYTAGNGIAMLDSAVRASSRFSSISEVVTSIQADRLLSEQYSVQTVVTYVFGENIFSNYCVKEDGTIKLLSEISSDVLNQSYGGTTVGELIKETAALVFLQMYCGIDLDNADTGAITGSDANLTVNAATYGENGAQILAALKNLYGDEAILSSDGQTLTLGTGITKNAEDIVPENLNTYTASNNAAQNIDTGSKGWVVNATNKNDTITSNGSDYVSAGEGDDLIIVNADGATISTGAGKDKVSISANVKQIKIADLSKSDELTILGNFEVGSAQVDDMTLVIVDKTGTRKISLAQFQSDTKINVGNASTTLSEWLADKINWDWSTATESATTSNASSATLDVNLDDISADSSNTVKVNGFVAGKLSNSYPDLDTFTAGSLTVHLRGIADSIGLTNVQPLTFNDLDDDQKTILAGLFKWWVKEALALNEESYGVSFGDDAVVHDIDLYFFYDESGSLAAVIPNSRKNYDGVTTALYLNINLEPYQNISADDVNGSTDGWGYLDRTLAHELNHAVFNANINYFADLPTFIKEGFAELTHGIDDDAKQAILRVARSSDSLNNQLNLNLTTTDGVDTDTYAAGYIFLRYFANQAANQTLALPTFGEITAEVNLANFKIGDVLYCDDQGNVSTDSSGILLGGVIDDSEIGGSGGDAVYQVIDNGVKQIIHTANNNFQVIGLTSNTELVGTSNGEYIETDEGATAVNTGDGEDIIRAKGQYATINAGNDNDNVVLLDGGHNLINLGDGDNYLEIRGEPFEGDEYIYSMLYDNSIKAGDGNDSISTPAFRYFDAEGYEVDPDNASAEYVFYGYHFNSNVDLGNGNNQIVFTSFNDSSIRTGSGDDDISITLLKNSTVNANEGDDIISFNGDNNIIDAGAGENVICITTGSNNTIQTATGTNYISISPDVEDFTVKDFSEDDGIILENTPTKFEIVNGKLAIDNTTVDGISKIGSVDYVFSPKSNAIAFTEKFSPGAMLDGTEISYSTLSGSNTLFTITGLNSSIGVAVDDNNIILSQEALAKRTANTITASEGYNLKLEGAENGILTLAEAKDASFEDGTYTAAITAETFNEEDGKIIYTAATGGQQFTITGLKSDAKVNEDILIGEDGKVTVKASALPENLSEGAKITFTDLKSGDGVNYSLILDENIAQDSTTHKGGWSGENGTFNFTEDYKLAHWAKGTNTYTYHEQTGGHKFKLSGLSSDLTADKFTSKTISVKNDAKTGYTFKILNAEILPTTGTVSIVGEKGIEDISAANCTLALDSKIANPKDIAESLKEGRGNKYTYTATGKSAGWSLVDGKIVYSAQVGGDQFVLSGIKQNVKLNKGVAVENNVVKVSAAALNAKEKDGAVIQLTDTENKYSLKLDDEILQKATTVQGTFTACDKGSATYVATHNLSYYEPTAQNSFTYRKQDDAKKITISNLKKTATLDDLDAITITEGADNKFNVKFNDDKILDAKAPTISGVTYTVELADKLNPALQAVDWLIKSTNASLKADTSAGYVIKNNKVAYSKLQTGKPQVILSGINKFASLAVPSENILTIQASTLGEKSSIKSNTENLTVDIVGDMSGKKFFGTTGDDTLKISASKASIDGGKGNDEIIVTGTGVTLDGGKGNDNFTAGKNAVLAYNKGDGLDTVTYAEGFKVSLNGSTKPVNVAYSGNNLIINLGKNDSITVVDVSDAFEVMNKKESLILDKSRGDLGKYLTFAGKNTAVTVGANFTGSIAPDDDIYISGGKFSNVSTINASAVTGELSIVGNAKSNTIIGGRNSTLEGGKGNDFFVYTGGNLTISDYGNGSDKISLGGATYEDYSISEDNVIINFGNGDSLTILDGAGKAINLVEGKNSTINVYMKDGILNSGMTAATVSGNSFDAKSYAKLATINAADSSQNVNLVGNAKSNVIISGKGDDTLTGGASRDTFIYDGEGADVITDYAAEDKISLDAGLSLSDVSVSGRNATLNFSEGGTLKLVGVGDKKVTLIETNINDKGKKYLKSATYTFEDKKIFNANKTLVEVTGGNFNAKNYANLTTINVSSDDGAKIDGNSKGNVITGGAGDDSLWGGAGNDVLTGGDGNDVFIYKPREGKDTITDYQSGELLLIEGGTFKNSAFRNDTLTLNIDGGGSVTFKKVDSSTEFNINGTIYRVNGKTLA